MRRDMMRKAGIICAWVLLAIMCLIISDHNRMLSREIALKDSVISVYSARDSFEMAKEKEIIEYVDQNKVFIAGDSQMNSIEFVRYVNQLIQQYEKKEDSLYFYKQYYSYAQHFLKASYTMETESKRKDKTNLTEYVFSFSLDSTKVISKEQYMRLISDSILLQKVKDKYCISIKKLESEEQESGVTTAYSITSPQIDSALVLLPYHRHELTYNPEKGYWIVTYRKERTPK